MFSDQRHGLGVVYSANQVSLQIVDAGDYNGNGTVDAADYVVAQRLGNDLHAKRL